MRQSTFTHSAVNVPLLQQLAFSRRNIQSPCPLLAVFLYKPFIYDEFEHIDQPRLSKLVHQSAS